MVESTINITAVIQEGPTYTLDQAQFGIKIGDLDVQCYVQDVRSITLLQTHKVQTGHAVSVTGRLHNLNESLARGVRPVLLITSIRSVVRRSFSRGASPADDDVKLRSGHKRSMEDGEPMETDKRGGDTENEASRSQVKENGTEKEESLNSKRMRSSNEQKTKCDMYTEFKEVDGCYFFMLHGRIAFLQRHLEKEPLAELHQLLDDMYQLYKGNQFQEFVQVATCLQAMLRAHYNAMVEPLPSRISLPQVIYLPSVVYATVTNKQQQRS
ncbi:hypothetical protein EC973_002957 [Apophysomyces ossiformis]|uniref:Uncharacterized protein n=1 Tax=Apophysomyces ossiformis TaxID=679940 RepID=A0A8H7BMZ7_9FUNG|nr:hypothetical protein EC973_002957 [Apophysomyces ossiformis]